MHDFNFVIPLADFPTNIGALHQISKCMLAWHRMYLIFYYFLEFIFI